MICYVILIHLINSKDKSLLKIWFLIYQINTLLKLNFKRLTFINKGMHVLALELLRLSI